MSPKVLLIILGVLIVLFFASTGSALLSGDQSVGGAAEAVVNMVRGLQTNEPLSQDDVIDAAPADCREQLRNERFVLANGAECRLGIGESSAPVRTLSVRLQEGGPLALRMVAGADNGIDETETLSLDNENEHDDPHRIELQFMREGGLLIITCDAGIQSQCILDVISS